MPPCTVLISDDSPSMLSSLAEVARSRGLSVISDGGSRAYELALEHRPDVVILDVNQLIPGSELLRRLKADPQTSAIPVVMMTGWCGPDERRACAQLGAEYLELKPMGADFWERLCALAELRSNEAALHRVG